MVKRMRSIYLLDNRANTAGTMETKQAGLGSFLMTVRTRTGIPVSRASPIITAAATATFCMAVTVSVNEKESVSSVSLSPSHRIIARYDNPSSRFVLTPFVLTSEPGKGGGYPHPIHLFAIWYRFSKWQQKRLFGKDRQKICIWNGTRFWF